MIKPDVIIVMGVSGVGKSAIAEKLSTALGGKFIEGDDFHPPANIEKMSSGAPLSDADRKPWITAIAKAANSCTGKYGGQAVIACSALTQSVRDDLCNQLSSDSLFLLLYAPALVIKNRLNQRQDHFMPTSLLQSQFDALEQPAEAIIIDADASLDEVYEKALEAIMTCG